MDEKDRKALAVQRPCAGCPFLRGGEAAVRLRLERYREIVEHEGTFNCHKTTRETGDGSERVCAGWAEFCRRNPEFRGFAWRLLAAGGVIDCKRGPAWAAEVADDLPELEARAI